MSVREFDGLIKTNFLGNEVPKENMHYTCIACITIDSVMRMNKKNHPQVYLEKCKYRRSQAFFETCFLLGLKIHKYFNQFN